MNAPTTIYRADRIATRVMPPPPPEFEAEFIKGGWRQVERIYGARTDLILKWIAMCGGLNALQAKRAAAKRKDNH